MNLKLGTSEQLSIQVANSLAGVFVNGTSLSSEISAALQNAGGKVYFDNRLSGISGSNDLSIIKLSADEYAQMLDEGTCLSNAIYIVEAPVLDAFGQRVANVSPAIELSDAVNLEQVSDIVSANIAQVSSAIRSSIPLSVSQLCNDIGYAKQNEVLKLDSSVAQTVDLGNNATVAFGDGYIDVQGNDNGINFGAGTFNAFNNGAYLKIDDTSSYIEVPDYGCIKVTGGTTLSAALAEKQPSGNYLTSHQSLSSYYQKSETSSATQISVALANKVKYSSELTAGELIGTLSIDGIASQLYAPQSKPSRYALIDAELLPAGSSISCAVQDQTITTIGISSSATPVIVQLPAPPEDGARDFILRIEISSSVAPAFTFAGASDNIEFDSEDDEWAVMEPGLNLVSFTETKRGA